MDWHDLLQRDAALLGALALALALALAACSRQADVESVPAAMAVHQEPDPAPATTGTTPAAALQRHVVVNGQAIAAARLEELSSHLHLKIVDGDYWYDKVSGAAGPAGGPTLAFIVPGLELGGPLAPDASAGNTGVFINGRELPQFDLIALTRLVGFVQPGRYFLDATGNAGFEGGPPVINLVAASRQAQAQGGGGDGWYSNATGAGGNASGGAGYVMGKDGSGNTWMSSY